MTSPTSCGLGGRAVALIDMDCFYCGCERDLDPSLVGVPLAVVQYNPFQGDGKPGSSGVISHPPRPSSARVAVRDGKVLMPSAANGSIIAVSYEARARGVTRFFRGREAVNTCPELILIQVPTSHGKSDMGVYRDYGARALKLIQQTCGAGALMEKASVDEMYIDLTKPARAALAAASDYGELLREAEAAGTHVAGAAEGEEEAAMGAQPTGVLARNSFRAGHSGQVVRRIGLTSARWWARTAPEWNDEDMLLAAAAAIVARARAAVTRELGFTCSAGIAANKLLAKLSGGLHKPNQQTILPASAVTALLDPLPIDRLRGFGGKLGSLLREGRPELGLNGFGTAGELRRAGAGAAARLLRGEWAHPDEAAAAAVRMASGLDDDAVRERPLAKQVGSSKQFSGSRGSARGPLDTRAMLERWLLELAADVSERLEQQARGSPAPECRAGMVRPLPRRPVSVHRCAARGVWGRRAGARFEPSHCQARPHPRRIPSLRPPCRRASTVATPPRSSPCAPSRATRRGRAGRPCATCQRRPSPGRAWSCCCRSSKAGRQGASVSPSWA